jgi:CheY-like chemotaxis protein
MPNVLIIESDVIIRNHLIRVLSQQGCTVYEASTADEALELCKSIEGDELALLIADYQTANTVTDQILATCKHTQVLHLVADQSDDAAQRERGTVPGGFLKKPFTAAELLQTIDHLLRPRTH